MKERISKVARLRKELKTSEVKLKLQIEEIIPIKRYTKSRSIHKFKTEVWIRNNYLRFGITEAQKRYNFILNRKSEIILL